MTLRRVAATLAVLVTVGGCARLGVWQVARMHEKERLRVVFDSTLSAEPKSIAPLRYPLAYEEGVVVATGTYDLGRQILLSARSHAGDVGVGVVTPLVLPDGRAVLVDRGWLPALDAMTADPASVPEPGEQRVVGMARAIPPTSGPTRWVLLPHARAVVWSTYSMSRDSLAARFPYPLLEVLIEQLPGAGVPASPRREAPQRPDPSTNFWYAVQWFGTALIVGFGALWLARRGAAAGRNAASPGG